MKIFLKDPDATADFGVEISKLISESKSNVIEIHLAGELGAGKTFLTKSILNSLGWHGIVKSPTYTLCDEYETEDILFLHVDLYRLVIIIEWPEIISDSRTFDLKVSLSYKGEGREALLENKLVNR